MKALSLFSALLGAAALCLAGCGKVTDADKAAALAVVQENLAAMKEKNVEKITATVHPNSPHFEASKFAGAQYDLLYDLKSAEIESAKGDTIRVRFVQETRKLSGPAELKDNRVVGVHTVRRDGAAWKLWSTEVLERTELGAGAP